MLLSTCFTRLLPSHLYEFAMLLPLSPHRSHFPSPPPFHLLTLQVPPFLAYYAVVNNNQTLLQEAYNQISLYRDTLRQSSGLWAHILLGGGNTVPDTGLWATGNAWAAVGMLRVLATMQRSQYAGDMQDQMGDLQTWTEDILNAVQGYVVSTVSCLAG